MKTSKIMFYAAVLSLCLACAAAQASPTKAPERIPVVMVGDRLVDVAAALGVLPEGMAVRASMWPAAQSYKYAAQLLGCPNYVTRKHPEAVAAFMKQRGIRRLILEKSEKFCLYMPKVNPAGVAELVRDVPGVTVEYVDFTQGVPQAVIQAAKLLGREAQGKAVAEAYEKAMQAVEKGLPAQGLGRRVLVLNGMYASASGKVFVRLEAPGGYTDQYILAPLGCVNAASALMTDTMQVSKGHVSLSRLKGLAKAAPDVIALTGDPYAVQRALHEAIKDDPALADMPAIRNGEVYVLPFYGDSDVLEYPQIFRQWQQALTR
ncbi:MAG: ABC transporter substrate-binding protein [Pseudodesulfovibrio sp.]